MGIFDTINDALTGQPAQPQPPKPAASKQNTDFEDLRATRNAMMARQGLDPFGDPLKVDSKHQLPGKPGHYRYK